MVDQPKRQAMRITVQPSGNAAGWRALWDWLLAVPEMEETGSAEDLTVADQSEELEKVLDG